MENLPDRSNVYRCDAYTKQELQRCLFTMEELNSPGVLPDITIYSITLHTLRKVRTSAHFKQCFAGCHIDSNDLFLNALFLARNIKYNPKNTRGSTIAFIKKTLYWLLVRFLFRTYRPDFRDGANGWVRAYTVVSFETKGKEGKQQNEVVEIEKLVFKRFEQDKRQDGDPFSLAEPELYKEFKQIAFKVCKSEHLKLMFEAFEQGKGLTKVAVEHDLNYSTLSSLFKRTTRKVANILRARHPQFIKGNCERLWVYGKNRKAFKNGNERKTD